MPQERRKRFWGPVLFAIGAASVVGAVIETGRFPYQLGISYTTSLRQTVFLIEEGKPVQVGDYIAFRIGENPFYGTQTIFVKRVVAEAGAKVEVRAQEIIVDGVSRGTLLELARDGQVLNGVEAGTVEEHCYFVMGDSADSYDSRYAQVGNVCRDRFIGRAYPLF